MARDKLPLHLCNSLKQFIIKQCIRKSRTIIPIKHFKLVSLIILILANYVSANLYNGKASRNSMLRTRVIATRYGKLQGIILPMDQHKYLKPVEVYLGVPYATPPIGSNRFSPTRAPAPWDGVKTVDQAGPVCPQRLPVVTNETAALERMPKGRLEYLRRLLPRLRNQSEDCLYMNIYTPVQVSGTIEAKHPVVIFIHGESFEWNAGTVYDGAVLASYAGMVVITLNYRLGILGFLNANPTPHLKARVANYGLMDQIAALHWVQQNIALFGGDSNNVTMIGHGSGAACINFLMISPTVMPGLFHRAVLLSGSALSSWALVEDPVSYSVQLAKQTNCSIPEDIIKDHEQIVDCLRDVPLDELMNAEIATPSYLTAFGPSVDGVVVKTDYAKELLTFFIPNDLQGFTSVSGVNNQRNNNKRNGDRIFGIRGGQNKYDLLFGVVTSEALWKFSAQDIQNGFEGERRDRIIRTYVRNAYTYHLSEIFFTVVNEYTDWERTVQHPINTRDAAVLALSDAQYVAPLVQTGDFLSVAKSAPDAGPKTFFYVFDYQTKDGDYPQRMGSVHGEELPYLFGAPLVEGFGHFPRNYTKSEVALSEAFILYVANFARTGNPNEHQRQESVLPISRERNRYKSIVWDEYDTLHQKYLEIGMKPRMKNHYRAHQLSVWLRLIPEIHRAGMKDVVAKHNLFRNHNDPDLYDGSVRPDPLTRTNYFDPTLEIYRKTPMNLTLEMASTTMDTYVTTCMNVISVKPGPTFVQSHPHNITSQDISNLEAAGYTAYSTALSVTIAIGCSLLILNVLIFAGVYYQRDKTRLQVKALQQQQKRNHNTSFDNVTTKHPHYFIGHSQSSSTIVDIDHQDKNAIIAMATNMNRGPHNNPHFTNISANCQNVCHSSVQMTNVPQKASPPNNRSNNQAQCMTLPRKITFGYQQNQNNPVCNTSSCMTLPKNATFLNNAGHNLPDVQAQTGNPHPPNGSISMHMRSSPPPRSMTPPCSQQSQLPNHHFSGNTNKTCNQKPRVPQAAMSEMNV